MSEEDEAQVRLDEAISNYAKVIYGKSGVAIRSYITVFAATDLDEDNNEILYGGTTHAGRQAPHESLGLSYIAVDIYKFGESDGSKGYD